MKKSIKIIFTILSFCCGFQNATAQPRMEIVGGDTYNWGMVKAKNIILTANLIIKNTGTTDLVINKVQPTCGCTTAPISRNTIAPGDTASLHIELKIESNTGTFKKTISIISNDTSASPKTLTLIANVDRTVQFRPFQYFAFTGMKAGKESSTNLLLKNNSLERMYITDIQLPEDISINITKNTEVKPGEEVQLTVTTKQAKAGKYQSAIIIKTSQPDYPEFSLPVYGLVTE